jgi:hypothetical protein
MSSSSNSQVVTPEEKHPVELILPTEDPEVIQAGRYLAMKDLGWTMERIANEFGYKSRTTMYDRVRTWEQSGALEKARQEYLLPKELEIRATISRVLDRWPLVLERIMRIALHGKDRTSLEAAAWLEQHVVGPELATREQAGSAEQAYANKQHEFNPTRIDLPRFLNKGGE